MHSQPVKLQRAKTNCGTASTAIIPNQMSISIGSSGMKSAPSAR